MGGTAPPGRSAARGLDLESPPFPLVICPALDGALIRTSHYVRLEDLEARLDLKLASPPLDAFLRLGRAERRFMPEHLPANRPSVRVKTMRQNKEIERAIDST